MRRLVVALFALTVALSMAGCSSGGSTAATPAATPAPAPAAVGGSTSALPPMDNRSENETTTFIPFPRNKDIPADLEQKVTVEKQPTLIYFYDSTQNSSKDVRAIIDTVRLDNRGLVDLVAYDIGKYLTTYPDGSVSVDSALSSDAAANAAVALARDPAIDVKFTPFIVLTDGQGYITFKHRGLIDREFLEREVLRASR